MSPNYWDKSWDFQHFSWEIQRLGSSNTGLVADFGKLEVTESPSGQYRQSRNSYLTPYRKMSLNFTSPQLNESYTSTAGPAKHHFGLKISDYFLDSVLSMDLLSQAKASSLDFQDMEA